MRPDEKELLLTVELGGMNSEVLGFGFAESQLPSGKADPLTGPAFEELQVSGRNVAIAPISRGHSAFVRWYGRPRGARGFLIFSLEVVESSLGSRLRFIGVVLAESRSDQVLKLRSHFSMKAA
ncbi:uncharacterized protein MYCFIDRAFT_180363 [Pseudocercospora fijiensis CIRAD86]|uniref:Uncharacterized protein n=1 Tax=Pseudocercospora fijiensis (strain CIRAD86) TaxID=383855 RepID=M3AHP0_PSEFD|nr:uncharacterized protein MYCFIDRAFT_180363 [Pseudocercospora fijiensis CIRAD86]EME77032.1 hypothetical protein MYCFIDRAFT_180363 [Pseudocercospora fijiensis CIRAD86]